MTPGDPAWLDAEARRLLEFGRGSRVTRGFRWLSGTGTVLERPQELWITCRMTHVFALAQLRGDSSATELVDHGIAALRGSFHDGTHGGWFRVLDEDGPVETDKTCYEHAFVVLAASSAAAARRPGAADLLDEAVDTLERFWDDEHGMLVEQWDRSWSTLDPYRGVNANMHGVEALLAAADVLGDDTLRERALLVTTRVVGELAPAHDWRLPEHFDTSWTPVLDYHADRPADPFRPYGATPGHALEWSRLTLHLRAALGDRAPGWMLGHARSLFDAAVRDGWAVDGDDGFVYTVDWQGRPVVRERMHWVVAEAIGAAATLHTATGDATYADRAATWWRHVDDRFRDPDGGSWWHELSPGGRPSSLVWVGKPDVYHAYQATLLPQLPLAPSMATALASRG